MIISKDMDKNHKQDCIATVGFFDGVHLGHQHLLHQLKETACKKGQITTVFTFPMHPQKILNPHFQFKSLNTLDEKLCNLNKSQIERCVLLDFTPELADLSAQKFIEEILVKQWNVRTLLVGHDHHFGHNRSENIDEYMRYGKNSGVDVIHVTPFYLDGALINSSLIRKLIEQGKVEKAAKMLSYPYRLEGIVVRGFQIGRTLGFPTANLSLTDPYKICPAHGVYAVWVHWNNKRYKGMLSIGIRPTIESKNPVTSIEVHLLDFNDDIYNQVLEVEFCFYLRQNYKFENLEALRQQLSQDLKETNKRLTV